MSTLAHSLLIGNLLANFIYGIFVDIAVTCAVIFYRKYQSNHVNWFQFTCFILLTILCTIKIVIDNVVTINAYTKPLPDGTVLYPPFDAVTTLLGNTIWVVETTVADAFIIYRVWVVWNKTPWLTIFPSILLLASLSVGLYTTYIMSTLGESEPSAFFEQAAAASDAFTSLTLGLNLICTALISYRIWSVRKGVSESQVRTGFNDPIKRVFNVVIESAAVYTILLVATIVTTTIGSNIGYIVVAVLPPVIATVFGSIIVRSSSGLAMGDSVGFTAAPSTAHTQNRNLYELRSQARDGDIEGHTGTAVQVKLDRVVTTKVDGESVRYIGGSESTSDDKVNVV